MPATPSALRSPLLEFSWEPLVTSSFLFPKSFVYLSIMTLIPFILVYASQVAFLPSGKHSSEITFAFLTVLAT